MTGNSEYFPGETDQGNDAMCGKAGRKMRQW
jgi:hypothetical protein